MQEWTTVDKSEWPERGPWDSEPDKVQWIKHNLDCLVVRGPSGALCGYVGVPESHPFFEKDYNEIQMVADVHGGLTFANKCADTEDPSRHICHTGEVANKEVWWFGFDCAHSGDVSPMYNHHFHFEDYSTYKDVNYVIREVENLAMHLEKAA